MIPILRRKTVTGTLLIWSECENNASEHRIGKVLHYFLSTFFLFMKSNKDTKLPLRSHLKLHFMSAEMWVIQKQGKNTDRGKSNSNSQSCYWLNIPLTTWIFSVTAMKATNLPNEKSDNPSKGCGKKLCFASSNANRDKLFLSRRVFQITALGFLKQDWSPAIDTTSRYS